MTTDQHAIAAMKKICDQRGHIALKKARTYILSICKDDDEISKSLKHFSNVTLKEVMPVFPALISISCEAVGGNIEKVVSFGSSIILITGAADLHDDVIDQSSSKGPKLTVFGKFGASLTVLAGDILLSHGLGQLWIASELLPKEQRSLLKDLVIDAILEISTAEGLEAQLKGRIDLHPIDFKKIIQLKAVVPELSMKMGAIIGGAKSAEVKLFGNLGRTYGFISIMAEEFSDLLDFDELKNRVVNECVPMPILYALQDKQTKDLLIPLLDVDKMNERSHEELIQIVLHSNQVQLLQKELTILADVELKKLSKIRRQKIREELETFMLAPLKFIEHLTS